MSVRALRVLTLFSFHYKFRVIFPLPACNPGAVSERGGRMARGSSPRSPTILGEYLWIQELNKSYVSVAS
jgi:hypothetical protein